MAEQTKVPLKVVVLVSGGIDSFLAYMKIHEWKENYPGRYKDATIIPVFINYGQPYVRKELIACKKLFDDGVSRLEILSASLLENLSASLLTGEGNEDNPFIPNRNLTLASMVMTKYSPDVIVIAGLEDDNVIDKNPTAFRKMSIILSEFSKKPVEVISPFWNSTKGQIVRDFLKNGGNPADLLLAVSCYNGGEEHCGNCPACFRRYVALESNGIDAGELNWSIVKKYLPSLDNYNTDRVIRTFAVLKEKMEANIWRFPLHTIVDKGSARDALLNNTNLDSYKLTQLAPSKSSIDFMREVYYRDERNIIIITGGDFADTKEEIEKWCLDAGILYHTILTNPDIIKSLLLLYL